MAALFVRVFPCLSLCPSRLSMIERRCRIIKACSFFNCRLYTVKKSALSKTDHCTWYLSTSVRSSIQLGGPGYGSYWEVWLPRDVHNYDRGTTYRNDGECWCWRGSLGIVQCDKLGQASVDKISYPWCSGYLWSHIVSPELPLVLRG